MKLLIIGDMHLQINNLNRSIELLRWVEKIADEQNVDMIINLGDTMHNHSVIRSELLSEFRKHLSLIARQDRPYFILVGNHDLHRPNDSSYHALEVFKDYGNGVTIVDSPINVDNLSFIPFLTSDKKWPTDTRSIIFCHQTFVGSKYANMVASDGMEFKDIDCDIIISGHIHTRQTIGEKILYPGTPLSTSANDIDQSKGLMIFDTETLKHYYIDSIFPMWKSHVVQLDTGNDISFTDLSETDHHVITFSGSKAEIKAAMSSKNFLEAKKNLSIQVKIEALDVKKNNQVSIKATDTTEMVNKYIDLVYKGSIDKEDLKKIALSYLRG